MALIRQANAKTMARDAIVLDIGDLDRQASRLIEHARAEAARIIDQARAHAQQLTNQADQRGHQEGFARGKHEGHEKGMLDGRQQARSAAEQELRTLMERWSAAVVEWERRRDAMMDAANKDVLRLALAVAEKIVHRAVAVDPTLVVDQVRAALAIVARPTEIAIHVHPDDFPLIDAVFAELTQALKPSRHARLADDATVGRGGCVVSMQGGQVDATLDTQLSRIAEALLPEQPKPPAVTEADAKS